MFDVFIHNLDTIHGPQHYQSNDFYIVLYKTVGTLLVAQLVEALRYKLEGRGFDSRWRHWIFALT